MKGFAMTEINLSSDMIAVGVIVSLVVELVKAIFSRWPNFFTETITKSMLPLLGCAMCMIAFYQLGISDPLPGGIAVGLMTAGGYDAFKGMAAARKK